MFQLSVFYCKSGLGFFVFFKGSFLGPHEVYLGLGFRVYGRGLLSKLWRFRFCRGFEGCLGFLGV